MTIRPRRRAGDVAVRDLAPMAATLVAAATLVTSPAAGNPRPLIDYFQPMPVVGKLSTAVWGAATVGPRDPSNGLEDNGAAGGVGPGQETYYYWDGKILRGRDGKYRLYGSRWRHANGFGAPAGPKGTGWESSIPIESISDDVMGPYVTQGNCYDRNLEGNDEGHNTTAFVAPAGPNPYVLAVGEIVPGQMFGASSPDGPWTSLGFTLTNANGHGCGALSSNATFTVGPDNRFWATERAGCIMVSDQILGPYTVQTDSVLPNLENGDNGNAEDEVIWYSGGYYHIVYNYWNVQRAYHIMSKDGLTNWTSTGLAYQGRQSPPNSHSNWLRYTDGTVNQWHNMERPGVYQENGHVTHFTFAVTDVDKNTAAVNTGGSKILVVPFDGVQFDCDNGDPASCAEAAAADAGTARGIDAGGMNDGAAAGDSNGLDAASGGEGGGPRDSDRPSDGDGARNGEGGPNGSGADGSRDAVGSDSGAATSGSTGGAVSSSSGVAVDEGGSSGDGRNAGEGPNGADGSVPPAAAGPTSVGGSSDPSSGPSGGCACTTGSHADVAPGFGWFGGALLAAISIRRRRSPRTSPGGSPGRSRPLQS